MKKATLAVTFALLALVSVAFAQSGVGVQTRATATAVVNKGGYPRQAAAATAEFVTSKQLKEAMASAQSIHWSDIVTLTFRHADGTVFNEQKVHNLVTNAGFDLISKAVSDTATQPASCNYVAVTNTAITPAAGDTTLSGEIASNGLTRAIGTFSHTNGTQVYTVAKVFTATGTQASQATGLFNNASTGSLCYEATYTQVTVNSGDTLTVTWTVTLS